MSTAGTRLPQPVVAGRPPVGMTARQAPGGVLSLAPGAVWRALLAQRASFWFTFAYLFFEYVRPQQLYPVIAVAPWAQISITGALVCVLLEGRLRFSEWVVWGLLGLFTAVIVASSFFAYVPSVAFDNWNNWINWLVAIAVIAASADRPTSFLLLLLGFWLWNLKMSQHGVTSWAETGFGWDAWGVNGPPGWFHNSGEYGIAMCVFFPIATYLCYGLWPRLGRFNRILLGGVALSAVIAMMVSASRGALVGGAAVALWMLIASRQRIRALLLVSVLAAATWAVLPEGNKERWRQAGSDETSISRTTKWKHGVEIAKEHPVLGVGYANWLPYYRAHYDPKGQLSHNLFIEAMAELGFTGLLVYILLIAATFHQNWRTRRLTGPTGRAPDRLLYWCAFGLDGAVVGYLASGFFVTVLFYPYFWINIGFTLALARAARSKAPPARYPDPRRWPVNGRPAGSAPVTASL